MSSQEADIRLSPEKYQDEEAWKKAAAMKLYISKEEIIDIELVKRSIDARGRSPKYQLRVRVHFKKSEPSERKSIEYNSVRKAKDVLIIGAGPCGYFAALKCIELGLRPIVLDRGKDVRARRRDLRAIQQEHTVHPDSNYCFGEGGAGTYSDGKLYTRSVKRGNVSKILQVLVDHGAQKDILVDAHPHIGSNKLPQIVSALRETIIKSGGEVHFDKKVVDFIIKDKKITGAICRDESSWIAEATILCTGHSARDIYDLCCAKDIHIEFKPFAIGMRLEHPQPLIDKIQYNQPRGDYLPAASYSLSCQVDQHGVFSFCMCPGGLIVPAATSPGELVVNGMSLSKRDSAYANAAMVVTIDKNPIPDEVLGGMQYQRNLENKVFQFGDGSQAAPAQRVTDFLKNQVSSTLPDSSYIPGIYAAPLHELLPQEIVSRIKKGLKIFDQRMKGYITKEAQFVGLESRTSAPVRIPRDKETCMHDGVKALFPAGEGAGYAGGILSAALDGERVAEAVYGYLQE